MNKLNSLYTIEKLVQKILLEDAEARNDDNYLIFKVYMQIGADKGIDLDKQSFQYILLNRKSCGFPAFETIRRTRQKIQQWNPDLRASDEVQAWRTLNEETFKDYARM